MMVLIVRDYDNIELQLVTASSITLTQITQGITLLMRSQLGPQNLPIIKLITTKVHFHKHNKLAKVLTTSQNVLGVIIWNHVAG